MELPPYIAEISLIAASIGAILLLISQIKVLWVYIKQAWEWVKSVFTTYEQVALNKASIDEVDAKVVTVDAKVDTLDAKLDEGFNSVETSIKEILKHVVANGGSHSVLDLQRREIEARWRHYDMEGKAVWETGLIGENQFGIVRVSEPLTKLAGLSEAEMGGKGWLNAVHPSERDEVAADWEEALANHVVYDRTQRFVHKDKRGKITRIVYVRAYFKPLFTVDGTFIGGEGHCFELTHSEWVELGGAD